MSPNHGWVGAGRTRRPRMLPWSVPVTLCCILALAGCKSTPDTTSETARQDMLALLMPSRLEIVKPFTRLRSFDDDDVADGVEVLLRAVNALDNPGLMIVGTVRVELFEYVPASAEPKGRRLEQWIVDLTTVEQQRAHWNQLTQMYELKLGVNLDVIPKAGRFVLAVTYTSPLGEHLTDQFVLEADRSMLGVDN